MEAINYYNILIDFDSHNPIRKWLFERRLNKRADMLSDVPYMIFNVDKFTGKLMLTPVKSNHGYHYYISMWSQEKLTPHALNFIQLLLGDDWIRCVYNFNRLLLGWTWKNSNIFFKENEKRDV